MQKQQSELKNDRSDLSLVFVPIKLDPDFPFTNYGNQGLYMLDSSPMTHLHHHDAMEIGYCHEGSGIFVVDNKIMPFAAGDACVVFKSELHIAKSSTDTLSKWSFVYLEPALLLKDVGFRELPKLISLLDGNLGFANITHEKEDPILVSVIRQIIDEINGQDEMYQTAVKGLTLYLLTRLSRSILKSNPEGILHAWHSEIVRISPALNYIFSHHHLPIAIPELAEICGMGTANLRRLFLKNMKISPLDFINHFRIRMASALLSSTDASILDISLRVGYETLSSFNRHFKKITGLSPREWRNL